MPADFARRDLQAAYFQALAFPSNRDHLHAGGESKPAEKFLAVLPRQPEGADVRDAETGDHVRKRGSVTVSQFALQRRHELFGHAPGGRAAVLPVDTAAVRGVSPWTKRRAGFQPAGSSGILPGGRSS